MIITSDKMCAVGLRGARLSAYRPASLSPLTRSIFCPDPHLAPRRARSGAVTLAAPQQRPGATAEENGKKNASEKKMQRPYYL